MAEDRPTESNSTESSGNRSQLTGSRGLERRHEPLGIGPDLDPFGDDNTVGTLGVDPLTSLGVSNDELKRLIDAHGRRLQRVEDKLDELLQEVSDDRPVGEVLQDVLEDELTHREAADELGWSTSRVHQTVQYVREAQEAGDE